MKRILSIFLLLLCTYTLLAQSIGPKREFRGVWMHTILNEEYPKLNSDQIKEKWRQELDRYQALGFNAVFFQVRPEADAFYASEYEPWSRYLTGEQGLEPYPYFDPMEFMIEECHKRCMEFHAWMNPYRANINKANPLTSDHIYYQKRYMFISYGKMLLFNPGVPESREHIVKIVKDVVSRYDIDGVHFDDYFYPYPIKGLKIQDNAAFNKYGIPEGYTQATKNDWRRNNVNLLVEEVSQAIKAIKPWVKFGISPFGIYRNKRQDENGSQTNGLSNYDDLYADVQLWINNGWLDYEIPQLYWEIGHKHADYNILLPWWRENVNKDVHLYIGQDVNRSIYQLDAKMNQTRGDERIKGNCFFSGKMILENKFAVADSLHSHFFSKPALMPLYQNIDSIAPDAPYNLHFDLMGSEPLLRWDAMDSSQDELNKIKYFAVYAFGMDNDIDITDVTKLIAITQDKQCPLPKDSQALCLKYVVTSLDRLQNESVPSKPYIFDYEEE